MRFAPLKRLVKRWAPPIATAAIVAFCPCGGPAAQVDEPVDLTEWPRGPVRYVLTKPEAKAFKRLDGENDRALFIERFWARRDPTPKTLANEYRALFWQRVNEANRTFVESALPGWRTDRGKVYILYGPPSQIEDYEKLDTLASPSAGRGLLRWIYEGRPEERPTLDPVTVVAFVRNVSGEYKLTNDPRLTSVFLDEINIREQSPLTFDIDSALAFGQTRRSPLAVMLDLGRLQEVPSQDEVLIAQVEAEATYRTEALPLEVRRFRHPERDGALIILDMRFDGASEETPPAVLARFTPRDATRRERILGEGSFRLTRTRDSSYVAQGRIVLAEGTWDLLVVAVDPRSRETSLGRATVVVQPGADEPSGPVLSDVVIASEIRPLELRALASYEEAYTVGPFKVVPLVSDRMTPGDPLELFYEIYDGSEPLRVEYRLEGQDVDGSWVELGRPATVEDAERVQGWQLPTSDSWPEGAYRVTVRVTDDDDRSASRTVDFELTRSTPEPDDRGTVDALDDGAP